MPAAQLRRSPWATEIRSPDQLLGQHSAGPFELIRAQGEGRCYRFAAVKDGLSNTIAFSECVFGQRMEDFKGGFSKASGTFPGSMTLPGMLPIVPLDCKNVAVVKQEYSNPASGDLTGRYWSDGSTVATGFNTILLPNSPSYASTSTQESRIIAPPTSFRTGGANVCMVDGSVHFISETIDCGDLTQASNYGACAHWGAGTAGSRDGGEPVSFPIA